jgi:hypothetical protein
MARLLAYLGDPPLAHFIDSELPGTGVTVLM